MCAGRRAEDLEEYNVTWVQCMALHCLLPPSGSGAAGVSLQYESCLVGR